MPPPRFRLRTIMIVIAALAALMGATRVLALLAGVRIASVRLDGSNVGVLIVLAPNEPKVPGSDMILYSHHIYAQIPLSSIVVPVAVVIALTGAAVYYWSRRKRRGKLGGKGIGTGNLANRPTAKPDPDGSGESKRV